MLNFLDAKFWTKLNELAAIYTTRILGGLVILLIGLWLTKHFRRMLEHFLNQTHLDPTTVGFVSHFGRLTLTMLVFIISLNVIGVPVTSVVAVLGTIGLAIALALKDSLNNVAAGLSLLFLRPFQVGNYIEMGSTGGTVKTIGLFHTVLSTPDNRDIHIPNAKLFSDTIVNYSANETRRVDLVIQISYGSNLKQAKDLLKVIVSEDTRILTEPIANIKVSELGDNGVSFIVRPWVKSEDYWDVRYDLIEKIKLDFESHQIVIPYPQQQVHFPEHLLTKN